MLLRLAENPPADAAALADVPGVGPALAERLGRTILAALGSLRTGVQSKPTEDPVCSALESWRAGVARQLGVPEYVVLADAVLRTIASECPQSRDELARIPGLGPRTLAKFGEDLLRKTAEARMEIVHSR